MFGSDILDVAIGLVLVFLLLSLIATAIREAIESACKTRAVYLERGICELLHGDEAGLVREIYDHPLVAGLYRGTYAPAARGRRMGGNLPSYIPTRNFALALLDVAVRGPATKRVEGAHLAPLSFAAAREAIARIDNPRIQRPLLLAADAAGNDLARLQRNVEAWFDSGMDRVSGWYKRRTQTILFVIGAAITLSANVDTVAIARFLYENRGAREALVAQAQAVAKDSTVLRADARATRAALDSLQLPIGWGVASARWTSGSASRGGWDRWVAPVLGWIITTLAITLGAPFWFDVLNKIMVIRSTVKPHEKSPEESSEDRQRPEPARPADAAWLAAPRASAPGVPEPPPAIAAIISSPSFATTPPPPPEHAWASGDPQEGVL
jgi:hypothetical protein